MCGPASVRLPVGARACSEAVYAGRHPVPTLEDLPHGLCSFFKQVQRPPGAQPPTHTRSAHSPQLHLTWLTAEP